MRKTTNMDKRKRINLIIAATILILTIAYIIFQLITLKNGVYALGSDQHNLNALSTLQYNDKTVSRHIFYHSPRVFSNLGYISSCFPAGEVMSSLPDAKCCEGLKALPIIDEAEEGCIFLSGASICSNCGNNNCDYGENICNCPADCKKN